jgi:hypothetical protein
MLIAVIMPFVATNMFYRENVGDGAPELGEDTAWTFVYAMSGAWLFFFAVFQVILVGKFRYTFWSLQVSAAEKMRPRAQRGGG